MNLHADLLFNASNEFGGENQYRFWSFVPYVGFGLAHSWSDGNSKDELAANAGLLHNIRLTDAFDVSIDMRAMFVNQRFAYTNGSKGLNVLGTVTAGISYKFNNVGFKRASDLIVIEDNTKYVEQIVTLEQMLVQANAPSHNMKILFLWDIHTDSVRFEKSSVF